LASWASVHARVEVVADVVVRLDRRTRARLRLQVEQHGLDRERAQAPAARDLLLEIRAHHLVDGDVERVGLPPVVHVRLAEADRGVAKDALVELRFADLDIARPRATDLDVGEAEQLAHDALRIG
jgi:hypothetical protein